jgi:hypothetical protein
VAAVSDAEALPPFRTGPGAVPALWFGFWMGRADRHRDAAAICRAVARTVPDRSEDMLAQAYAHDLMLDDALINATAWGSRP